MFWKSSTKVSTDQAKIDELLTRGVENVIPRELAQKKLKSGERLRVYFGIDPTGSDLHIGHTIPLRKLRQFAELGHQVIFVVGSFTAMIGDPTGRDAARQPLTRADVEKNFKDYTSQAAKVLDLSKVEVRYNHEWLDTVRFEKIVELAGKFTVQQMLQRDMFEKRVQEGKPISLHEFLYPLMVGYDSVVLDVDAELGGSDQEFNMLAGRHLQTVFHKRDKFVLTTKLIEGIDGRKMSKSYGNGIYLSDTPAEMFGKVMSASDTVVKTYFETCTDVSLQDIERIVSGHPKDAKVALAHELVRIYHGVAAADAAKKNFDSTFSKGEVPESITEVSLGGKQLADVLVEAKIVESKSDYRRLETQGAINKISEDESGTVYRIGKHRFVKIVK